MASSARIDELKKKFEDNPRRFFAPLANEYRKAGDLEQAIALCRAHLPNQTAHISGHIVLAQALYEAGSTDESRTVFEASLELDPENLIALRYLGDLAREGGDVSTARSWYTRMLEVDPRNDEIGHLIRSIDEVPLPDSTTDPTAPEVLGTTWEEPAAPSAKERADALPHAPPFESFELEMSTDPVSSTFTGPDSPRSAIDGDAAGATLHPADDQPGAATTPDLADDLDFGSFGEMNNAVDFGDLEAAMGHAPTDSPEHEEKAAELTSPGMVPETRHERVEGPDPALGGESSDPYARAAFADEPLAAMDATLHDLPSREGDEAPSLDHEASGPGSTPDTALTELWSLEMATVDAEPTDGSRDPADPEGEAESELSAAPGWADDEWDEQPDSASATASPRSLAEEPVDVANGSLDDSGSRQTSSDMVVESMEFVAPDRRSPEFPAPLAGMVADPGVEAPPAAFVTETMAELYLQQGFRVEAVAVYRELLAQNPGDDSLRERIEQLESGSASSISIASLSEDVVAAARRRQSAAHTRSIRAFLGSMAARRAPRRPEPDGGPGSGHSDEGAGPEEVDRPQPAQPLDFLGSAARVASSVAGTSAEAGERHGGAALDRLFPDARVPAADERAANSLASAFSTSPLPVGGELAPGRPARVAESELSLSNVFRDPQAPAARADAGGFSFDQFFSSPASPYEESGDDPQPSPSSHRAQSSSDIEQFTAWLEGLKKK